MTQIGDIYELNNHRIGCGDSTDEEFVIKMQEALNPILMVTDPPYGVKYDPKWRDFIREGSSSAGLSLNDNVCDWSRSYSLFTGSVAYIWCASLHLKTVIKNIEDLGFEIISLIIWNKNQFILSRGDYHWKHEPCLYAVKKGHKHNWKGDRKQSTVWDIKSLNSSNYLKNRFFECENDKTTHSAQKPVECMARPIRNNSEKNDYIYDPFLGSGTTIIACEHLERKCVGIEINPEYVDLSIKRYIKYCKRKCLPISVKKNGVEIKDFTIFDEKKTNALCEEDEYDLFLNFPKTPKENV